jgi:toxin CptA
MSSTVSVTPLSIEIRPSRWLARYVLSVYAAAALTVIGLPISPWVTSTVLCILSISGLLTYQTRVRLRSRRAVVALNRCADASWQLRSADGTAHQARLLPDSYLHPELLVLNFRLGNGKRRSVVLVRDSADKTTLRRLRVALALVRHEPTN